MDPNANTIQWGGLGIIADQEGEAEISPPFPTDAPLPSGVPPTQSASQDLGGPSNLLPQARMEQRMDQMDQTLTQLFELLQQTAAVRLRGTTAVPAQDTVVAVPSPIVIANAANTPMATTQMYTAPPPITPAAPPLNTPTLPPSPEVIALQQQLAAMATQLAAVQQTTRPEPAADPFEKVLLRQIQDMRDYDGTGTKPWLEFQQAFISKASLIPSLLPKSKWVRMLHSKVVGPALLHAKSVGLVVEEQLQDVSFDEYCGRMNSAMFGEVLTVQGYYQRLISVTQEGPLSAPVDFLREKEKFLNKIPLADLSPLLRAGSVLIGMDPALRQAVQAHVKADPNVLVMGQEFQFQSYEQLKSAVLAVVSMQNEIQDAARKRSGQPWQHSNLKSPRTQATTNQPFQTAPKPSTSGAKPSGPPNQPRQWVPVDQRICKDCGRTGHFHKGWHDCPLHPGKAPQAGAPAGQPKPPAKSPARV